MEDKGQILLYQTPDGESRIEVRLQGETVWLNQEQIDEPEETEEQDLTDAEEEREIAEYNESFEPRVDTDDDEPEEASTTEGDLFGNSDQVTSDDNDEETGSGNADADNFLKSLYGKKK